jgi:hypothetical protein
VSNFLCFFSQSLISTFTILFSNFFRTVNNLELTVNDQFLDDKKVKNVVAIFTRKLHAGIEDFYNEPFL